MQYNLMLAVSRVKNSSAPQLMVGHEFKKVGKHPSPTSRCIVSCSTTTAPSDHLQLQESIERIREMFKMVEISASAYDTAWVAMAVNKDDDRRRRPCFPQCLNWVMENQHPDGCWGLHPPHPLLVKDYVSSTLACVLALRKWRVGEQLVQRGLEYIERNRWAVDDKDQLSPLRFEIEFGSMVDYAPDLDLRLPFDPTQMNVLLRTRDSQTKRMAEHHLAYFAEGVTRTDSKYYWRWVHRLQRRSNGSLLNSPATTAAALVQQYDVHGFQYLSSVLDTYKSWVPTFYPVSLNIGLRMVDTLERLGVSRHFRDEIRDLLDKTYRLWQQKHDEIFSDVECCAMAFRLLRQNADQVSSEELAEFAEEEYISRTTIFDNDFMGVATSLELYKASQLSINLNQDVVLQKIYAWTCAFLKEQLLNHTILDQQFHKEQYSWDYIPVEFALENCHGVLERLESRQCMELYDVHKVRLLKTSYRCPNIDNRDFLTCAQQDFNTCQASHQKELEELERWYKEYRLEQLKFSRHYLYSSYFLMAATLFEPQLFNARIAWTQLLILITVVDDLLDNRGTREEILKLLELVQVWDGHSSVGYCSKDVETSFTALHDTTDEIAAKALLTQGRCVRQELISLIQEMINVGAKTEFEWWNKGIVPTMEEYLFVSCISVGCKPLILATIYFLGEKFPQHAVNSNEFSSLCRHLSAVARLNNGLQTFKKERAERKVNSCLLQLVGSRHGSIVTTEEAAALTNIREMIESHRTRLLQMVLDSEGSLLPNICRDLFWKISKTSYYLYSTTDEYNSPKKMRNHIHAVLYDPVIQLPVNEFND